MSYVRKFITRLSSHNFFEHVGVLLIGTVLGQAIILLVSPVLTRIYTPEHFATLALFMAIVATLSQGICGRYEIAIAVMKDPRDSQAFFGVAVVTALFFSFLVLLFLLFFGEYLAIKLNNDTLVQLILVVPIALLFNGTLMSLRYFANSFKIYYILGIFSILQPFATSVTSIILGFSLPSTGLLIGVIIGYIVGILYLAWILRDRIYESLRSMNVQYWQLAWRRRDFLLYNAPTSILDGFTIALPVFFLSMHYDDKFVGFFALLSRVAMAPLSFVALSVSQVYLRKVSELLESRRDVTTYLRDVCLLLAAVATIPTLILFFWAEPIFAFFFGEQWRQAGTLLTILMPAIALRFIVSTVSGVFSSTGNNHLAAIWKITACIATFTMFWLAAGNLSIIELFYMMLFLDLALYSLYYAMIWYAVLNPRKL